MQLRTGTASPFSHGLAALPSFSSHVLFTPRQRPAFRAASRGLEPLGTTGGSAEGGRALKPAGRPGCRAAHRLRAPPGAPARSFRQWQRDAQQKKMDPTAMSPNQNRSGGALCGICAQARGHLLPDALSMQVYSERLDPAPSWDHRCSWLRSPSQYDGRSATPAPN
jgi:hypothetical protein